MGQIRPYIKNRTIAIPYSSHISDLTIRKYYRSIYRAGRSGDRIPVEVRFSTRVQTGPAGHLASRTMGSGSFPGVKRPGRGVDHPPTSSAEVKERVELYLYSPSELSWPVLG
jgi:hypothetical protein